MTNRKLITFSLSFVAMILLGISTQPVFAKSTNIASISLNEAKAIALEHAGLLSSEATFTKAKLSGAVYELKFVSNNKNQYEYNISSLDGRILDYDWDIKNPTVYISLEDAKLIALTHANENAENVLFKKEKLDDGVYELDFKTKEGNKYEYEISCLNGSILNYEKDVKFSTSMQLLNLENGTNVGTPITEAEAKQIALTNEGVTLSDLNYLVSYISWSEHVPSTYEVKFGLRKNFKHYVYSIDLYTGKILNIRIDD